MKTINQIKQIITEAITPKRSASGMVLRWTSYTNYSAPKTVKYLKDFSGNTPIWTPDISKAKTWTNIQAGSSAMTKAHLFLSNAHDFEYNNDLLLISKDAISRGD